MGLQQGGHRAGGEAAVEVGDAAEMALGIPQADDNAGGGGCEE